MGNHLFLYFTFASNLCSAQSSTHHGNVKTCSCSTLYKWITLGTILMMYRLIRRNLFLLWHCDGRNLSTLCSRESLPIKEALINLGQDNEKLLPRHKKEMGAVFVVNIGYFTLFCALISASCCNMEFAMLVLGIRAARCRAVFPLSSAMLASAPCSRSINAQASCWHCTAWIHRE